MNDEQYKELLARLDKLAEILTDIGKIMNKQTLTLEFIARESQEKNDWESWKRY